MSGRKEFAALAIWSIWLLPYGVYAALRHNWLPFIAVLLCTTGALLNRVARCANGGRMPVKVSRREYLSWDGASMHTRMNSQTRFPWLCDIFHTSRRVYSIGDVALTAGILLSVVNFVLVSVRLLSESRT